MGFDALTPSPDNYIKGGATVLFKRTGSTGGYVDLGNIPDFSYTNSATYLEHKTARSGVLVIDRKEQIEGGFSFKIAVDEFSANNLSLMLNADAPATFSQAAATGGTLALSIANPVLGDNYSLGHLRVTDVIAKRATTVTLTAGTDYSLAADAGLIRFLPGGAVLTNDTVDVTMNKPAITGSMISPLSNAGILRGAIIIIVRTSDGRLMMFQHTVASLAYEGDIAIGGSEFAKAAGTVSIEKDSAQTDEYGKWTCIGAAA